MTYHDHLNGIRALQTQTTTGTAAAASHTSTDAGGGSVGGDDAPNNNNIFGGNGSAPLVPAFILTGFLLAAILLMTWWRRVARPAGARMPFARVGGGMFYFPAAFDGPGAGPRREREKVVGPKPEMFDLLVRQMDRKEKEVVDEKGGLEWEDVKVNFAALHAELVYSRQVHILTYSQLLVATSRKIRTPSKRNENQE